MKLCEMREFDNFFLIKSVGISEKIMGIQKKTLNSFFTLYISICLVLAIIYSRYNLE